jgi:hypothetical protein
MRHRGYRHYGDYHRYGDNHHLREREHHPRVSIGLFFILLGAALLVATNDLLHLGSINKYFTWETAMLFIGLLLLLNLHFTGGLLLIAGGLWFLNENLLFVSPEFMHVYFWPAVIALVGLSFILNSLIKRKNNQ